MRKLSVYFSLLLFFEAGGQNLQPPVAGSGQDTAISIYFARLDQTLPLHNGRVFYGYPGIIENAFFPTGGWQKGSVLYDGIWYHDLSLMYDVFMDEVIVLHPSSTPVRLISERIEQFKYHGLSFERLGPGNSPVLKTGFYQQLVVGPVTIYARRTKKIEENIVDLAIERKFVIDDHFYAFKEGSYTPIYKQKTLLEMMKDKRQGVVYHLKKQGLKFRKNREKAIVQMAEFYNQSPN
jgi:hypothetical protein